MDNFIFVHMDMNQDIFGWFKKWFEGGVMCSERQNNGKLFVLMEVILQTAVRLFLNIAHLFYFNHQNNDLLKKVIIMGGGGFDGCLSFF